MLQYKCEEMQIPRTAVYTVPTTICPETLYTQIFNSHQTRKNILWNMHLICMKGNDDTVI